MLKEFRPGPPVASDDLEPPKSTPRQKIIIAILLVEIVSTVALNIFWGKTGIDWMYWFSRFLGYSQVVMFGIALIICPVKLGEWLKTNLIQNIFVQDAINHEAPGVWTRILGLLVGLFLVIAGGLGLFLLLTVNTTVK